LPYGWEEKERKKWEEKRNEFDKEVGIEHKEYTENQEKINEVENNIENFTKAGDTKKVEKEQLKLDQLENKKLVKKH